jgi:predicted nucleic acid-binding protein
MLRVTADPHTYLSALQFDGAARQVLERARAGTLELAISPPILEEVGHLLRDACGWSASAADDAATQMGACTLSVEPTDSIEAVAHDPHDDRVIECAIAARAVAIIAGDRHLLDIGAFRGIRILKPTDFIQWALDRET